MKGLQTPRLEAPSGYYICDAFLMLDFLLGKKLFRPAPGKETRAGLASEEAVKAKRCLGSLRYLWRNSTASHDPYVLEMKSHLCPSPLQGQRRRGRADEASECDEDLMEVSSNGALEDEPMDNGHASDCPDSPANESTAAPSKLAVHLNAVFGLLRCCLS